jgi:hypothetical protein
MADITPARKLFDLLVSRDFDPEMLDSSGKPAPDPAEAEIFSFDFRAQSGKDYGTVVIMLGDDNDLEIYCSDNVGRSMEGDDKNDWFSFLEQLKNFAVRNFMSFGIKNLNRLRYSMQGQAAIKEGLFESWTGNRTTSWNGAATEARLMIRHKKTIAEGDARFRYIESLFIETADSERYKLPFKSLTGGRAMLEHVRQGGRPYDLRGNHISEMVTELAVLSRFRRANQGQIFEGDTAQLVEQVQEYQSNLQRSLKGLGTRTGYTAYFESWSPAEISEQDVVIESLKSLFVKQSIDTRIESALPLLAKIQQQGTAMKEANIFEAWAERLTEGTWQLPDTPEKQAQLLELMSTDLPVGADATNVTEQLYDLLGDDELFDQLEQLAERDANADARQVIYDRMQMLSDHPDVLKVIEQLQIDPTAEMNPPEATPADLSDVAPEQSDKVPGGQGTVNRIAEDSLRSIRRAAGLLTEAEIKENVLTDDTGSTLQHIKDTFKRDIKDFEKTGEMSQHLHDALFDYYRDDMPYGTQKASDGDPYEWVSDRFGSDLGLPGYGMFSPGVGSEDDPHLERESVMHGDYAEEDREPHSVDGGMDNPLINEITPDEMAQAEWLKDPKNREAIRYAQGVNQSQTSQQITTKASLDSQTNYNLRQAVDAYKNAIRDIEHKRQMGQVGKAAAAGKAAVAGAPAGIGEPTNVSDKMGQQITDIVQKAQSGQMDASQAIAFINKQTQQVKAAPVAQTATPAPAMEGDDLSLFDDVTCNMTEAGETCPVHGVDECWANSATDSSPLAGQYGHSGKMKEVGKETSFLDRLKELSGMIRN